MIKIKVAVYCGASHGNNKIYINKTIELAKWIANNNNSLVFGGGNVGLMGTVADSVLENGGEVIGVMPNFLAEREIAHKGLTKMHLVKSMHERKSKMIDLADCFIALPGGPGTLEEITEVISWGRIGQQLKPCILFNINGFYNNLRHQYDLMVSEGFLSEDDRSKILFTDSFDEIESFIECYNPPDVRTY